MYLFTSKVICGLCGWNYRAKTERRKRVYVCNKYSSLGACERHKVDEDYLVDVITQQFEKLNLVPDVRQVKYILVTKDTIKIFYKKIAPSIVENKVIIFSEAGQPPERYTDKFKVAPKSKGCYISKSNKP